MLEPDSFSLDHLPIEVIERRFVEDAGEVIFATTLAGNAVQVREDYLFRWLTFQDGITQSAILKRRPDALLLAYSRAMMAALLFQPQPDSALLLGLGGGSIVRFLSGQFPRMPITAVDVSETISQVADEYFGLPPQSPYFKLCHCDAVEFIRDSNLRMGLIFVDLYDPLGISDINGSRFYSHCRSCLSTHGILVANLLISAGVDVRVALSPLREAFAGRVLIMQPDEWGNFIVFAFRNPPLSLDFKALRATARHLQRRHGLAFPRFLDRLRQANPRTRGGFRIPGP